MRVFFPIFCSHEGAISFIISIIKFSCKINLENSSLGNCLVLNICFSSAIRSHSPAKPVLIFVSSRRQTRLTALELIAFLATEDDPKQWLSMDEREVNECILIFFVLVFILLLNNYNVRDESYKTLKDSQKDWFTLFFPLFSHIAVTHVSLPVV